MSDPKVVIFDDSNEALERYVARFKDKPCEFFRFTRTRIDGELGRALVVLNPDLIVVDLVLGESRQDGYRLIGELRNLSFPDGTPPLVVCSKLITDTPMGEAEKSRAMAEDGVVAAYGKFPDLPSAATFLGHARRSVSDVKPDPSN